MIINNKNKNNFLHKALLVSLFNILLYNYVLQIHQYSSTIEIIKHIVCLNFYLCQLMVFK